MPDATLLCVAFCFTVTGLAWLALSMPRHWRQVRSDPMPTGPKAVVLRLMGVSSLLVSLLFCLRVDHASIATLVWIMSLAVAALSVTLVFTWRPRVLAPLVSWL